MFDRLPALGYENSFAVRFGSVLDDPNGFGQLLALFIGFAYYYYHGWKCILIISTLFLFLLFTQSMTAILSIPISIIIIYLFNQFKVINIFKILSFLMLITFLFIIVNYNTNIYDFIKILYMLKQGSIHAHIYGYQQMIDNYTLSTFIGINPLYGSSESDLINILSKGLMIFMLHISLFIITIHECRLVINNHFIQHKEKAMHTGIFLFTVSVLIGSVNLPFTVIFPINALIALFLFLSNRKIWTFSYKYSLN